MPFVDGRLAASALRTRAAMIAADAARGRVRVERQSRLLSAIRAAVELSIANRLALAPVQAGEDAHAAAPSR